MTSTVLFRNIQTRVDYTDNMCGSNEIPTRPSGLTVLPDGNNIRIFDRIRFRGSTLTPVPKTLEFFFFCRHIFESLHDLPGWEVNEMNPNHVNRPTPVLRVFSRYVRPHLFLGLPVLFFVTHSGRSISEFRFRKSC